jgi:hypothetical protein
MATPATQDREEAAIGRVRERLQTRFSERRGTDVAGVVSRAVALFTGARIRDYVPLLVERISRDELNHRPHRLT